MAQVPQIIKPISGNEEHKEIDVIDITGDDDESEKAHQPTSRDNFVESLPYVNLEVSNYGKIVYRDEKNKAFLKLEDTERESMNDDVSMSSTIKCIDVPGYGELKMLVRAMDKSVVFPHPQYDKHDVMCPDSSSAVLWINEYLQKRASMDLSQTKNVNNLLVMPEKTNKTPMIATNKTLTETGINNCPPITQ